MAQPGFQKIEWLYDSTGVKYPKFMVRQSFKTRREYKQDPESPGFQLTRLVQFLTCRIDCAMLSYAMLSELSSQRLVSNIRVLNDVTKVYNTAIAGIPIKIDMSMAVFEGVWTVEEFSADTDGAGHDTVIVTFSKAGDWEEVATP